MMPRVVADETLDNLAESDPRAMRSRRDLRRVHRMMGTRSIILRALRDMLSEERESTPIRILELGAGDGSLMLGVAQALEPTCAKVRLTLLDRQSLVERTTISRYAEVGWTAEAQIIDVLEWAAEPAAPTETAHTDNPGRWDMIIANLFLHHFEGAPFDALLGAIADKCDRFFACEPRRARLALAGSHLLGVIGVNAVTREDAVISVHAGFRGNELTTLWPAQQGAWRTQEYSAGLFSHCFRAERVGVT